MNPKITHDISSNHEHDHVKVHGKKKEDIRLLIVGAGGIGCQLLKNLYKKSYKITVMDYDTVSETNLNRQFCFRKQDIGKYKVDVLHSYFKSMNPRLNMQVKKDNLFNYSTVFFSEFDVLISALDNNQARLYLNQVAIDHCVPMIDAGTSGFNGQSQLFQRYVTQCRMCRPQGLQQASYAVCTLRGRPQRNIHCINFALNLFKQIMGIVIKMNKHSPDAQKNSSVLEQHILGKYNKSNIGDGQMQKICMDIHNYAFGQIYTHAQSITIQQIYYDVNGKADHQKEAQRIMKQLCKQYASDQGAGFIQSFMNVNNQQLLHIQKYPPFLYSYLFVQCLVRIFVSWRQLYKQQATQFFQEYDKDNCLHILVVFCAANLKVYNFKNSTGSKLSNMSFYQCKDMSGKIIPAIASTNSIAAALQVLLLRRAIPDRHVHEACTSNVPNNSYRYFSIKSFISDYKVEQYMPSKPKANCAYCSHLYNYAQIYADMGRVTWGQLEWFLSHNFDDGLQHRDVRCKDYVVIRNTNKKNTTSKNSSNKDRLLNFNTKLIQQGMVKETSIKALTIRYTARQQLTSAEPTLTWKFTIIHHQFPNEAHYANKHYHQTSTHRDRDESDERYGCIKIKKGCTKQQYRHYYLQQIQTFQQVKQKIQQQQAHHQHNILHQVQIIQP